MKVTCPNCGHASQVDGSKIPEKGVQTKCRKCDSRFTLTRKGAVAPTQAKKPAGKGPVGPADPPAPKSAATPSPAADAPSLETAVYTCEKCKHKQHPARACVYCGNPFPQFAGASPRTAEKEATDVKPTPAPPASGKNEPEGITPKPAIFPIAAGDGSEEAPGRVPCPYCDEPIREGAKKCKHCGEFLDKSERVVADPPVRVGEVFSGLIDFRFKRMITPELVKALYIVALALGGIGALTAAVFAVRFGAYATAAGSIVGYLLMVLLTRVYAELSIIAFKIEENTRRRRR